MSEILNSKVLVLNRSYLPVHITSVRRALSLLYCEIALAVDAQYRTFDFRSWRGLEPRGETIGLDDRAMPVPRVILLRGLPRNRPAGRTDLPTYQSCTDRHTRRWAFR